MKGIRTALACAMALAVSLSGCSKLDETPAPGASGASASAAKAAVKQGGKLTLAAGADFTNFNPLTAAGDTTGQRQQQWPFYPHPFLTMPDGSVVVNDAFLESAKVVSPSPMKVEYKIKKAAVWSDGTPITAADFQFTQFVQDPKKCKECKAAFTEGYSSMTEIASADDGRTVTITFAKPFAQWQALFNYILPAHVAKTYGTEVVAFNDGFTKEPPKVSGGPYVVSDYKKGISMTMSKNPKWYGKPANLDTIVTRYISGQGEQLTALQNGEIDMVYQVPTQDTMNQAKALQGTTVQVGAIWTYYHLGMKTTGDIMSDAALRKGIAQAINLADIRTRTVAQFANEIPLMKSAAYVPGQKYQGVPAYQETTDKVGVGAGDTKKAIATLEAAGYKIVDGKLTKNGTPVRDIKMLTLSTDQLRMQMAQIVQSQLKQIGLTVTIDPADSSRYSTALRAGSFDIMATGTALDLGSLSLAQWYDTKGARSFGYSNPAADKLFAEAEVEVDPAKLVALMNKIDETLIGDGVVLPLFATPNMAVYKNTYANIFVNPSKYGTTMNVEEWGLKG